MTQAWATSLRFSVYKSSLRRYYFRMNHPEAVSTVTSLMRRFPAEGVSNVLTKYARAHDLSPAQLAKLGTTYNTISALSTYEKSADRGANAHQIDVGSLVAGFADKPMRKAASSDPLSTHGEHVDLYNMFRRTLETEREQMPDEHAKDTQKNDEHHKPAQHDHHEAKFLKEAAEDLDNTLDVQALHILRSVKKEAGVYDLSHADEDARHAVDSRFVAAAMRRISAHAAGMPVPAKVVGMSGPLEKRAFAITSPVGNLLTDMAFNVAALDATVRMHKAAEEKSRGDQPVFQEPKTHVAEKDDKPYRDSGGGDGVPVLAGHAAHEHSEHSAAPSTPPSQGFFGGLLAGRPEPVVSVEELNDAPADDRTVDDAVDADAEQDVDAEQDTDEEHKKHTPKKQHTPKKRKPQTDTEQDHEHRQDSKTKQDSKSKSSPITASPNSFSPVDFLRSAASIPIAGVGMLDRALSSAADSAKQHVVNLTTSRTLNKDQAHVDRSVDDIRRSFVLRKVMHNDHVLSQADPMKVTKYYNQLADAYPDLATNPEALTLALREAVAYDGIPPETVKNLTSTRLDAARAHNEEHKVRENTYRI